MFKIFKGKFENPFFQGQKLKSGVSFLRLEKKEGKKTLMLHFKNVEGEN